MASSLNLQYPTERVPQQEQAAAEPANTESTISTPTRTAATTTTTTPSTEDKKMDGCWNNSATKQSPALDLNQAVTNEDDIAGEPLQDSYHHISHQQAWRNPEATGLPEREHRIEDVAPINGGKGHIPIEIEDGEPRRNEKGERRVASPTHRSPRVNGSGHGRRSRSPSPRRPYPSRRSLSPSPAGRRSLSRSPPGVRFGRGKDRYMRSPSPPSRHRRYGRSRSRSPYYERERYRSRYSPRRRSPPRYPARKDRSPRRRPWSPPPNRNTGIGKPGNNLFVAGFSFVTSERDLEKKFSRFGRVTDVRIIRDRRSGDSRGFGFLSLERDEDADAAIRALDQTEWNGRIVLVEKAKTN